jgi:23S rRNA pseudouridine2605 synthase
LQNLKIKSVRKKISTKTKPSAAKAKSPLANVAHPNRPVKSKPAPRVTEEVRLNKYISNSGVCSRRKADEYIKEGLVKVNGQEVYEMGYKVKPGDVVHFKGERVVSEAKYYVLLNKPKDFITTTSDELGRKTVLQLVKNAAPNARLYPVGRLDRNTTGLLLLTNDGDLAQKLSHPSSNVIKVYQAELNKPITKDDLEKIRQGIMLEDGLAEVDEVDITYPQVDAHFVGVAIHIGKNRIVRRIFEHLGYDVVKLDRVSYAGLTKKDLPRGKWRFLTEKELILLKHMNAGTKKPGKSE